MCGSRFEKTSTCQKDAKKKRGHYEGNDNETNRVDVRSDLEAAQGKEDWRVLIIMRSIDYTCSVTFGHGNCLGNEWLPFPGTSCRSALAIYTFSRSTIYKLDDPIVYNVEVLKVYVRIVTRIGQSERRRYEAGHIPTQHCPPAHAAKVETEWNDLFRCSHSSMDFQK